MWRKGVSCEFEWLGSISMNIVVSVFFFGWFSQYDKYSSEQLFLSLGAKTEHHFWGQIFRNWFIELFLKIVYKRSNDEKILMMEAFSRGDFVDKIGNLCQFFFSQSPPPSHDFLRNFPRYLCTFFFSLIIHRWCSIFHYGVTQMGYWET